MNVTAMPPKGAGLESLITEKKSCWERLRAETRPIFIYGMGDGSAKIMSVFRRYGITVAGIFASDDFVRGHSFAGYRVHRLSEVEEMVEDFVIVLGFAAGYPELIDRMHLLARKHTLYVPDVPVIGGGLFDYHYCMEHLQELNAVYRSLADDESRRVMLNVIQYKISGCIHYLDAAATDMDTVYREILRPNRTETFVDLGAYNGDTVRELLEHTHRSYSEIHAIEPDRKNFKKLVTYIENSGLKRINAYHCAAWCKDAELPFSSKAGRQSVLSPNGETMSARSVDSILHGRPATFIKMDVEGFEREAIWGAVNTIRHFDPKLSIAVYHRNEDLFELPLLVKRINPKYRLYLRRKPYIPAWETNLYAVAD